MVLLSLKIYSRVNERINDIWDKFQDKAKERKDIKSAEYDRVVPGHNRLISE